MTLSDGMGSEVGGRVRMGNTATRCQQINSSNARVSSEKSGVG